VEYGGSSKWVKTKKETENYESVGENHHWIGTLIKTDNWLRENDYTRSIGEKRRVQGQTKRNERPKAKTWASKEGCQKQPQKKPYSKGSFGGG